MERLRAAWHKILDDIHKAPIWVWIGGALTLILIYFAWRNSQGGSSTTLTPLDTGGSGPTGTGIGPEGPLPPLPPVGDLLGSDPGGSSGTSVSPLPSRSAPTVDEGTSSDPLLIGAAHTLVKRLTKFMNPPSQTTADITAARVRRNANPGIPDIADLSTRGTVGSSRAPLNVTARGLQQPPHHLAANGAQQAHPVVTFRTAGRDRHALN